MVCDHSLVMCIVLFSFQIQVNICLMDIGIAVARIPGPEIARARMLNLALVIPTAPKDSDIPFTNKKSAATMEKGTWPKVILPNASLLLLRKIACLISRGMNMKKHLREDLMISTLK